MGSFSSFANEIRFVIAATAVAAMPFAMMPSEAIVDRGFAGVALRLAVDRAATFFFAALVLARFGIARLGAFAFFADRFVVFFAVVFRPLDFFALLRAFFFATGELLSESASYAQTWQS